MGDLRPSIYAASVRAAVRHRRGYQGRARPALAQGADPQQVALALARELRSSPTTLLVLVLEDLHWADEATLDVFTLLVRRAGATPALIVGTYRDDALENSHPLRRVLGELATTTAVRRMKLAPLSREAVGQLAGRTAWTAKNCTTRPEATRSSY